MGKNKIEEYETDLIHDEDIEKKYLQAADFETPDLWSRIEAGVNAVDTGNIKNKKHKNTKIKKYYGFLAAAVILVVIVPLWMHFGQRKSFNGKTTSNKASDVALETNTEAISDETSNETSNIASDNENFYEDTDLAESAEAESTGGENADDEAYVNTFAASETIAVKIIRWQSEGFVGVISKAGNQNIFSEGEEVTFIFNENTEIFKDDETLFEYDFDEPNADEAPINTGEIVQVVFKQYEYTAGKGIYNRIYPEEIFKQK